MDGNNETRKQVGGVVTRFVSNCLTLRSEASIVDLHDDHVLIMRREVVCPLEREHVRERNPRELLERLFSEMFDAVKPEPETMIEG